ncbi:MAG: hypothetical protein OER86_09145 [Phycisphaerae bacterium]|nr:hypothetical protein [Phycisphaerae bacterium]
MSIVRNLVLLLAALVMPACHSSGPAATPNWELLAQERFTSDSPYLVMDTPVLREKLSADPAAPLPAEPWWQSRNDGRLNVRVGARGPEITDYTIWTVDRQQSHGGRIHDRYHRTAYTRRTGRLVR